MEAFVQYILLFINEEKQLSKEEYEIYKYGLRSGTEIMLWILVSILTAVFIGYGKEALIFMVIFISTRSSVGGIHLKKYGSCFIMSYLIYIIILLMSDRVALNSKIMLAMMVIQIIIIGCLCELDDRICKLLKIEVYGSKKGTYFALILWGIIFTIAYFTNKRKIQSICLYTFMAIMISKLLEVTNKVKLILKKHIKG